MYFVYVAQGALVLRSHLRRVYRLEDLVKRMIPRNVYTECIQNSISAGL
jgi:hypothetical protein